MAHQTKYEDARINLPEISFSRYQGKKGVIIHQILHRKQTEKKTKSVKNYPVATQLIFAAIQLVPIGQAHIPA